MGARFAPPLVWRIQWERAAASTFAWTPFIQNAKLSLACGIGPPDVLNSGARLALLRLKTVWCHGDRDSRPLELWRRSWSGYTPHVHRLLIACDATWLLEWAACAPELQYLLLPLAPGA